MRASAAVLWICGLAALLWTPMAVADEGPDADADGASKLRLLPVPIFITEPSIGQGLGASLMFIHPRSHARTALEHVEMPDTEIEFEGGSRRPPDVAAVFGAATDGDLVKFESQDPLLAGGIGGSYLFADDLGLWVGVDVARGPEEYVGYIQVGHAL